MVYDWVDWLIDWRLNGVSDMLALDAKVVPNCGKRNPSAFGGPRRPFLRWAGGKYYLTRVLLEFTPRDVNRGRYFEPFLGGGSLYFALGHQRAHLSDANGHLVECYQAIREHPLAVANALAAHARSNSARYYYAVRDAYNRSHPGVARAARFLYLNRTGFNGVFRVNMRGQYNVPYGKKPRPRFPNRGELNRASALLRSAKLTVGSYAAAVAPARDGDFVYLDPPYPPLNGTSYFTHYTADRFGPEDQAQVADCARALSERGCRVMISNADTPGIRRLYRGFVLHRVAATRYVTSKSLKHQVGELIITNYGVNAIRGAPQV